MDTRPQLGDRVSYEYAYRTFTGIVVAREKAVGLSLDVCIGFKAGEHTPSCSSNYATFGSGIWSNPDKECVDDLQAYTLFDWNTAAKLTIIAISDDDKGLSRDCPCGIFRDDCVYHKP